MNQFEVMVVGADVFVGKRIKGAFVSIMSMMGSTIKSGSTTTEMIAQAEETAKALNAWKKAGN